MVQKMFAILLISILFGLVSYTHTYILACNNGIQQSPINIEVNNTEYSKDLDFETKLPKSKFGIDDRNNSLTFTLNLDGLKEYPKVDWIRRSGNSEHYDLNHFDFRWSSNDSSGSEHSIDNKFGAAELRLHYYLFDDIDYETALTKDYGVLVQIYILELGKKLDLAEIFNFNKTDNSGNVELDLSIFSISSNSKFLKYDGSLNSCAINQWLVMMDIIEITREQLDKLRSLNSEGNVNEQHSTDTDIKIVRNFKIQVILKYYKSSL